jgi:hypothetical protein
MQALRRALGEDLSCSLARAWQELGNDCHALVHVAVLNTRRSGLPTEHPRYNLSEQLSRRALAVVEGGGHLPEDFGRIGEQVSGIEAKRLCNLTLCL